MFGYIGAIGHRNSHRAHGRVPSAHVGDIWNPGTALRQKRWCPNGWQKIYNHAWAAMLEACQRCDDRRDSDRESRAHRQAPSSWLSSLMRAVRPPRRLISAHTDELRTASRCTHAATSIDSKKVQLRWTTVHPRTRRLGLAGYSLSLQRWDTVHPFACCGNASLHLGCSTLDLLRS